MLLKTMWEQKWTAEAAAAEAAAVAAIGNILDNVGVIVGVSSPRTTIWEHN